jgi:hypothetical protein
MTEYPAKAGMGKRVRGRALGAKDGFSVRRDLDRIDGVPSQPDHKFAGQSRAGRVPMPDLTACGVGPAWMQSPGMMPAALMPNVVTPTVTRGVPLADFTVITGFATDAIPVVPAGALPEDGRRTKPSRARVASK